MVTFPPLARMLIVTATLVAFIISAPQTARAQDEDVSAQGKRPTVDRQLQSMRLSLARIRRTVDALSANNTKVSNSISDVKNSLGTLNQRVITGTSVAPAEPTPAQSVIGQNKAAPNYLAFDFYTGLVAEAIVQHKNTGVLVKFRTSEKGKTVQEYVLDFSFVGRSSEQKAADTMMITACLNHFHRAADAPNGGTFFIYPSADDKLGLLCSSHAN
jgi:hypothetical protein